MSDNFIVFCYDFCCDLLTFMYVCYCKLKKNIHLLWCKSFHIHSNFYFSGGKCYDILLCTVLFLVCKLLRQLCFVYIYPRRHMECVGGANGGKRVKRGCVETVWRSSGERRDLFQWPDDPHYMNKGRSCNSL